MPLVPDEERQAVRTGRQLHSLLPITLCRIRRVGGLPRHYGDPFDRMLVAQAIEESLVLVTGDATVQRYPVAWLW